MAFAAPDDKTVARQKIHLRDFNATLVCSVALLFFSAFSYGFSDQSFASTQATAAFKEQFGDYKPKKEKYVLPALFLSLLNSLKAATQLIAIGVIVGNWISKHYGRRWCIFVMSIYALGSTSVIISAYNRPQILAGRTLHYVYLGMQLAVIPTFLAEIAPAHLRGGTGALYWLSIKCGGLLVTGIVRATSRDKGDIAWQLPIGLIMIFPAIVIALVWLIPESPRWLLLTGRHDKALVALTRLRQTREEKRNKAPASEEILAEFSDLSEAVEDIKSARRQREGSRIRQFLSIFNRDNLRRTLIVVFLLFFQQSTGQSFASQYGTLFVEALNTINPFSVTLGTNAVDIGGILFCILLADRLGRRPVLITSAFVQTVALFTMGGLGTADPSTSSDSVSIKAGIVAMLLLFSFGWSFGYAPLAYVVAAEIPSPYLREYTLNVGYTVKLVMEFVVSFTYPYLEDADKANLGGKLGFIYGSVAFLSLVFSIFFVPETKNLELEEMDEVFTGHGRNVETKEETAAATEEVTAPKIVYGLYVAAGEDKQCKQIRVAATRAGRILSTFLRTASIAALQARAATKRTLTARSAPLSRRTISSTRSYLASQDQNQSTPSSTIRETTNSSVTDSKALQEENEITVPSTQTANANPPSLRTYPYTLKIGTVTSVGLMNKTVRVAYRHTEWDRHIRKPYPKTTTYLVADPRDSLREGDVIEFSSGAPRSRHVRHVVERIIAPFGEEISARPAVMTRQEREAEKMLKRAEKLARKASRVAEQQAAAGQNAEAVTARFLQSKDHMGRIRSLVRERTAASS
ncbi:hypothetical protein UA08_03813 [Talaromyces atroroseus]|uniref:Uncharacterized protein n=1 Tax=Talaromyces atroroseus TaxID=1441469 RepID=A0A225B4G9_TALAT|nr:hypothetical protein UA08_03813 [Talaromyces atroroseus]OKL60827.1 hypothetical protein UA08_03813 [Talaromyces atroroseus]